MRTIWDYHQLHHPWRRCSAAIALGSFDLGVATYAATLFKQNYFPLVMFTGASSPTTIDQFPRSEAIEYREHALSLGVPDETILVKPHATNTGQNITLTHQLLDHHGIEVTDLMLICMPYMQRGAYATCAKHWPEVAIVCASEPITLAEHIQAMGADRLVIDELVGDLQRIWLYPRQGFAIAQPVPDPVMIAYHRLVDAGFDSKVLPQPRG
jgi:uncharacterized SAM-binding protein YcdF (DUF218 family)